MNNENNSIVALDKILKIKNTKIDQLSSEQSNKLAKYLEIFSKHNQTLHDHIKKSNSSTNSTSRVWLCYFTYIHYSRYHSTRDSYFIVCLDNDISNIIECSIDYPNQNKIKIEDILTEEDKKFHEERLKKPREAGYC